MELAEQALELFTQARDALSEIRSPFSFGGEGSTREKLDKESPTESKILDQAYVVIERYNKHSELFSKIYSLRYRFSFYFDIRSKDPFVELRSITNEVVLSARRLARYWLDAHHGHVSDRRRADHDRRIEEAEAIFWEGSSEDDLIKKRMDETIKKIENICKNAIEPKANFWLSIRKLFTRIKTYFSLPNQTPS